MKIMFEHVLLTVQMLEEHIQMWVCNDSWLKCMNVSSYVCSIFEW